MQFPEFACSPFFVWAAHKNFAVLVQSHNWWDFQGAKRGPPWSIQGLSMIIMDGPWWSLMVPSKKIEIHDIQLQKCPQLSCFGSLGNGNAISVSLSVLLIQSAFPPHFSLRSGLDLFLVPLSQLVWEIQSLHTNRDTIFTASYEHCPFFQKYAPEQAIPT